PSTAAGRHRMEYRELAQPSHLQRHRRTGGRPQYTRLFDSKLSARHGQRRHDLDARDRCTDPDSRAPLGWVSDGIQALNGAVAAQPQNAGIVSSSLLPTRTGEILVARPVASSVSTATPLMHATPLAGS